MKNDFPQVYLNDTYNKLKVTGLKFDDWMQYSELFTLTKG